MAVSVKRSRVKWCLKRSGSQPESCGRIAPETKCYMRNVEITSPTFGTVQKYRDVFLRLLTHYGLALVETMGITPTVSDGERCFGDWQFHPGTKDHRGIYLDSR